MKIPNLKLPYRWFPLGTRTSYYWPPDPGALVALAHQVWRVIEVTPVPEHNWTDRQREKVTAFGDAYRPNYVVLRPAHVTSGDPRDRDHDLHLTASGARWEVYPDEHYPVCATCGEPLPCREQMAAEVAAASAKHMDRYSTPGVCPACTEPITTRQKSVTFPDNVEIPGGPPVTYHAGRGECRMGAAEYEQRWASVDPDRRRTTLSCPGNVINHNDGTYECTELNDCRGPAVRHPRYERCRCPDCHARGVFDCHPEPGARLLKRDVA